MKRILMQCGHYDLVDSDRMISLGDNFHCAVCSNNNYIRKIVKIEDA